MACLGAVLYDPATAATASTATAIAMTAFDTTNARVTFTAPANGIVLVKIRAARKGSSTNLAQVLLGVLNGIVVLGRQAPVAPGRGAAAATLVQSEAALLVTGLAAGVSYAFDAAYGVETVVAATQFGWGGPNNATASDAYGALSFEVWETTGLLGGVSYDPAIAVTKATTALLAMTALDTTNLRVAFTTAASGAGSTRVLVRLRGTLHGATTFPSGYFGVLDGAAIKMRQPWWSSSPNLGGLATDMYPAEACAVISGLTASTAYTWDAAYGVETVVTASGLKYGGPNLAAAGDSFGGFTFEVWNA